jgi:hypothetical protein
VALPPLDERETYRAYPLPYVSRAERSRNVYRVPLRFWISPPVFLKGVHAYLYRRYHVESSPSRVVRQPRIVHEVVDVRLRLRAPDTRAAAE